MQPGIPGDTRNRTLGKCTACKRRYHWQRKLSRPLSVIRCPGCNRPLERTSGYATSMIWFDLDEDLEPHDATRAAYVKQVREYERALAAWRAERMEAMHAAGLDAGLAAIGRTPAERTDPQWADFHAAYRVASDRMLREYRDTCPPPTHPDRPAGML